MFSYNRVWRHIMSNEIWYIVIMCEHGCTSVVAHTSLYKAIVWFVHHWSVLFAYML